MDMLEKCMVVVSLEKGADSMDTKITIDYLYRHAGYWILCYLGLELNS